MVLSPSSPGRAGVANFGCNADWTARSCGSPSVCVGEAEAALGGAYACAPRADADARGCYGAAMRVACRAYGESDDLVGVDVELEIGRRLSFESTRRFLVIVKPPPSRTRS